MTYLKRIIKTPTRDQITVTWQGGVTVAVFDDEQAFNVFVTGCLHSGDNLFDADAGQYLVGTVAELDII